MNRTARPDAPRIDAPYIDDDLVSLAPDPGRTIVRFFLPGNEDVGPGDSRAGPVIERILDLDEGDVVHTLEQLHTRIAHRHPDVSTVFEHHAEMVLRGVGDAPDISPARRSLLGAAFSHEYSIEGAALCNPSIVRHPVQAGDGVAFVLSLRGIGEGHRSSIGFRTGAIGSDGSVTVDRAGPHPHTATITPGVHHRRVLHRKLDEIGDDHENAAFVLDQLPASFDDDQLAARIDALADDASTRRHTRATITHLEDLARCSYRAEFAASSTLSECVLWPQSPIEWHGMEDARFVEITDESAPRYCATYTAYDGTDIAQNLLTTDDFVTFDVSPMAGAAARGKGLALFPRSIAGRHVALSRSDRETNSIAFSDDLRCWDSSETFQTPRQPWEILQLGNCGSPIETDEGWLVLTHGVGVMRTYAIGALLLDLDEPQRVIASTDEPILTPKDHRGYVPNVVYSCGAIVVDGRLVLPYGIGDQRVAIATLALGDLIASMRRS